MSKFPTISWWSSTAPVVTPEVKPPKPQGSVRDYLTGARASGELPDPKRVEVDEAEIAEDEARTNDDGPIEAPDVPEEAQEKPKRTRGRPRVKIPAAQRAEMVRELVRKADAGERETGARRLRLVVA